MKLLNKTKQQLPTYTKMINSYTEIDDFGIEWVVDQVVSPPTRPSLASKRYSNDPVIQENVIGSLTSGMLPSFETNYIKYEQFVQHAFEFGSGGSNPALGTATFVLHEYKFQPNGNYVYRSYNETVYIRSPVLHKSIKENESYFIVCRADIEYDKTVSAFSSILRILQQNRFVFPNEIPVFRYISSLHYEAAHFCTDRDCNKKNGLIALEDKRHVRGSGFYYCPRCHLSYEDLSESRQFDEEQADGAEYESDREEEIEEAKRFRAKFKDQASYKRSIALKIAGAKRLAEADVEAKKMEIGNKGAEAEIKGKVIMQAILDTRCLFDSNLVNRKDEIMKRSLQLFTATYARGLSDRTALYCMRNKAVLCIIKCIRDADNPEYPRHTLAAFESALFSYDEKQRSSSKLFRLPPMKKLLPSYSSFLQSIGRPAYTIMDSIHETLHSMLVRLDFTRQFIANRPVERQRYEADCYYRVTRMWNKVRDMVKRDKTVLTFLQARVPEVTAASVIFQALKLASRTSHPWPSAVIAELEKQCERHNGNAIEEALVAELNDSSMNLSEDVDNNKPRKRNIIPAPEHVGAKECDAYMERYQLDKAKNRRVPFRVYWLHILFGINPSRMLTVCSILPQPELTVPHCTNTASSASAVTVLPPPPLNIQVQKPKDAPASFYVKLPRRRGTKRMTAEVCPIKAPKKQRTVSVSDSKPGPMKALRVDISSACVAKTLESY